MYDKTRRLCTGRGQALLGHAVANTILGGRRSSLGPFPRILWSSWPEALSITSLNESTSCLRLELGLASAEPFDVAIHCRWKFLPGRLFRGRTL